MSDRLNSVFQTQFCALLASFTYKKHPPPKKSFFYLAGSRESVKVARWSTNEPLDLPKTLSYGDKRKKRKEKIQIS